MHVTKHIVSRRMRNDHVVLQSSHFITISVSSIILSTCSLLLMGSSDVQMPPTSILKQMLNEKSIQNSNQLNQPIGNSTQIYKNMPEGH